MRHILKNGILAVAALTLLMTSCQRSSGEVVEDTKTAGRYVGKGLRSLGGKHGSSRQVASSERGLSGPSEEEFIPLDDEDHYRQLTLGNPEALETITQDTAVPQSNAAPGEMGSMIPGVEGFKDPKDDGLANVFQNLHFDTNDHIVRGRANIEILDTIADYLQRNPDVYVFIEGHCDERGAAAYNLALGSRRSNSVRNLLVKQGIDLNRIFTVSYGKERPLFLGHSVLNWDKNRRAQFKIYRTNYTARR